MIRYKKLGYVALNVTDIEKSAQFYEEVVGLQLVERVENGPVFFRCSRDHHNIVLYSGDEPGLRRIGLEVEDPEQLDIAYNYLKEQGLDPIELDVKERRELKQDRTFRIEDPVVGVTYEFYSDITQVAEEFKPTVTNIARLGHVVLNVVEFDEVLKFMTETLNFKQSDRVGERVVFLRCFPNPYHHSFAIGRSNKNSLHHVNFMVTDIDDVGKARNRLNNYETPIVFGPGKHDPSGSIFLYFLDPDEMTLEYSFGMEEFPEEKHRKARLLDNSLPIIDTWGGRPDPKMAKVGKLN
ncbi:2,3-dihydroxy-p-cumate/2,3-dihydroxybenzoate 3,4-dioxygenase [Neobacillus niacini]|uniref:VOC family protein n=1 Tax=Neobacillus niacini TaxID=86668 RepID=UPI0027833E12|nr:VOC family protein [Neobacillus niacini]MDQ1002215.1 2,3-dihydroxy-p-cumate/2,3-dihydroxybenzoate 3,4-dioxygenase [Neobacillus niacini]